MGMLFWNAILECSSGFYSGCTRVEQFWAELEDLPERSQVLHVSDVGRDKKGAKNRGIPRELERQTEIDTESGRESEREREELVLYGHRKRDTKKLGETERKNSVT